MKFKLTKSKSRLTVQAVLIDSLIRPSANNLYVYRIQDNLCLCLIQPRRWDNLIRDTNEAFALSCKDNDDHFKKQTKLQIQVQWLNQGYAKEHKPRYSTPVRDDMLALKSASGKCYLDGPS